MKGLIIDASVALKWRLDDENCVDSAIELQKDFINGDLELYVPFLFDYEIANALNVAVKKERIAYEKALKSYHDFLSFDINRVDIKDYFAETFQIAQEHNRSIYDSTYIALAKHRGIWFYTGDERLFNSVKNVLQWVKWIGNYDFDNIPDKSVVSENKLEDLTGF